MPTEQEAIQFMNRAQSLIASATGIPADQFDISLGSYNDRSTWKANFYGSTTAAQRQQAADILANAPVNDARLDSIKNDQAVIDLGNRIKAMTAAEIDAWFQANVTTLAQARNTMATIVKLLATRL